MAEESVMAMAAPPPTRDNPLTRSVAGILGLLTLAALVIACVGTLPITLAASEEGSKPRYAEQSLDQAFLPPLFVAHDDEQLAALEKTASVRAQQSLIEERLESEGIELWPSSEPLPTPTAEQIKAAETKYLLGTDNLGRSVLVRCLTGGGVSIGIGIAAAAISVFIGTLYGAIAGYAGGKVDAVLMRIVDVLYGLPYILLVVLLAVAGDAVIDELDTKSGARGDYVRAQAALVMEERGEVASQADATKGLINTFMSENPDVRNNIESRLARTTAYLTELETWRDASQAERADLVEPVLPADAVDLDTARKLRKRNFSEAQRTLFEVVILLVAIGGVSWLTMARVIRGQVLSLKAQPFMEAANSIGTPVHRKFIWHLLPNLIGPIVVYATLTVPQAILQESFLSFLGIGVQPPLPSWGNLAADGLKELNPIKTRWWLLLFPCLLLGTTLLALNFVGEGLREAFDPKRARK